MRENFKKKHRIVIIIIIIIFIGIGIPSMLFYFSFVKSTGDLGTWIGSLTTSTALLLTLYQIFINKENDKNNRKFEIEQKDLDIASPIYCDIVNTFIEDKELCYLVKVVNNTEYPIYDIVVGTVVFCRNINPDNKRNHYARNLNSSNHLRRFMKISPKTFKEYKIKGNGCYTGHGETVAMAFYDTRGNSWVREAYGELKKVDSLEKYFGESMPNFYSD